MVEQRRRGRLRVFLVADPIWWRGRGPGARSISSEDGGPVDQRGGGDGTRIMESTWNAVSEDDVKNGVAELTEEPTKRSNESWERERVPEGG